MDEQQDENRVEVKVVFNGRVQGVGFRYAAKRHAEWLNVAGTVSNRADGSVEMYAQGVSENVAALIEALKTEPTPIAVHSIESTDIHPLRTYHGFRIV